MSPLPPNPPDPEWWVPNTDIYISENGSRVIDVELAAIRKEDLERRESTVPRKHT